VLGTVLLFRQLVREIHVCLDHLEVRDLSRCEWGCHRKSNEHKTGLNYEAIRSGRPDYSFVSMCVFWKVKHPALVFKPW